MDNLLNENIVGSNKEIYQHLKDSLHQAAKEALGEIPLNKKKRGKRYWITQDLEQEIEEKKRLYEKWLSTKKAENKEEYKIQRNRVRNMIRKEKQQSWERKCQEVEMYIGGTKTNEIWKFIKQVKSPKMEKVHIQSISVSKWEEYFKKLFQEGRSDCLGITERETTSPAREITVTEERVKRCIKGMKDGKAPGPGEIPSELIKNGTPKLVRIMTKLINSCINKGDIPEDWKIVYITPIHKKGRKDM